MQSNDCVGERQLRQVGGDEPRPVALEPIAGPAQHLPRQVGAGDASVGVGVLEQVPGDLPGAAADVEDRLGAAQVEPPRAKQPLAQRNVQRQHAARGQHGALAGRRRRRCTLSRYSS